MDVEAGLAARFADAESKVVTRETEARAADAKARREALARMQHLLGRVETLVASPDLSLKAADRALREVRMTLAAVPLLPGKPDADDVTRRLKVLLAVLTPKVLELREADEWQRWANVGVQERLCAQMEALRALEDPEAISREVRELQQQWRLAADVPRAQADQLWRRFKTAHDDVWVRAEAYFAAEAESRAQNLAQKTALCEKAEALAGSTSWIQTADEIKRMQAEWKTIGPVSRGREKAVWDRFRAACDRFFSRRQEDLAARKGLWAENLAKKEALSVRAEALVESTDWEQSSAELRRLQAEWKTIGPVKKSRSDAIWRRFREACDRFFTRYAHRHDIARAERVAAREAICAELEALGSPERQEPAADLLAQVRALRARMQQEIAARGVDPEQARAIEARFAAAFAALLARWPAAFSDTDLDPEANRKRMESLVRRVEDLATSLAGPVAAVAGDAALSPTTRLAAMLKEALAANTIGGKVDDDSRWRAAMEDVRQAQDSWSRIGLVPDEVRRPLTDRFQRAIRRISEGAAARAAGSGRAGGPGTSGGQAEPERLDGQEGPEVEGRKARRGWKARTVITSCLSPFRASCLRALPAFRVFRPSPPPASPALLDLDQLHVEHEQAERGTLALVGEVLGNPEARRFALDHQLHAFSPPGNHSVQRKGRRLPRRHRAVEHFSIGRPSAVMHRHRAGGRGPAFAGARLDHLVRETARCLLRVGRGRLHVGWRRGRRREREQLHVEHEHASRIALPLVGQRFRDPEPPWFRR